MTKQPVQSVPVNLINVGWQWECTRQAYFTRLGNTKRAEDCRKLAALYASRLYEEHGVEVR